ncbi:hypothetical protein BAE44_0005307, partial [Dichanthelium oligosanthes]
LTILLCSSWWRRCLEQSFSWDTSWTLQDQSRRRRVLL